MAGICSACTYYDKQANRCWETRQPNAVRKYITDPATQETGLRTLQCDKYAPHEQPEDEEQS